MTAVMMPDDLLSSCIQTKGAASLIQVQFPRSPLCLRNLISFSLTAFRAQAMPPRESSRSKLTIRYDSWLQMRRT
jgi:hypothetical protein